MMAEEAKGRARLRFIREEPWIARTLRTIKPLRIVPDELHDWLFDWVEDVGAVMRSREMMVGIAASIGYYAILMSLMRFLGATGLRPLRP
jgi:hypothetical protein